MSGDFSLLDARVVMPHGVERVSVNVRDGWIHSLDAGPQPDASIHSCSGDYLLPGFVELHTDNVERHLEPRPGTFRSAARAVLSHDSELAAAGITTAFDALTFGADIGSPQRDEAYLEALVCLERAEREGLLRARHLFHLRCELSDPGLGRHLVAAASRRVPRLLSLMDHTPGQGQWEDVERFRRYYGARYGLSTAQIEDLILRRQAAQRAFAASNREISLAFAREHGCVIASHDASTTNESDVACADGCRFVEFPTALEAARRARELSLAVIAGAPNLVRGGSHSGNVSASALAREGLLNVLSSDYCPATLLEGVFLLATSHGWTLPNAVATASATPAQLLGLNDRGCIEAGRRADLIRVRESDHGPVIVAVWCGGRQVA
jgi:alpha-D-ribose 1-methylphosphonate 5-triphosphate diphosphatase